MALSYFANWFVLFPLAISLFVGLQLAEGSTDSGRTSIAMSCARIVVRWLMLLSLLAVGWRSSPLSLLWLLALGFLAVVLVFKARRLSRNALLMTALNASGSERQRAVADGFATLGSGWPRRRARQLIADLDAGRSWWISLAERRIAKGNFELLALRLKSAFGPSPKSATQADAAETTSNILNSPLKLERQIEQLLGRFLLFSWVLIAFPICGAILVFFVKQSQEIYEEFGLEASPRLQFLSRFSTANSEAYAALFFGSLSIAFVVFAGSIVLLWMFPNWMAKPGLRWFSDGYFRSLGFFAMHRALEHETDLHRALQITASLVPVRHVARRYESAAHLIHNGASAHDAFYKSGLLNRAEASAISAGSDQRQSAWAWKQLSDWTIDRLVNRYTLLMQFVVFVATLLLAIVVGFFAYVTIELISDLSQIVSNW